MSLSRSKLDRARSRVFWLHPCGNEEVCEALPVRNGHDNIIFGASDGVKVTFPSALIRDVVVVDVLVHTLAELAKRGGCRCRIEAPVMNHGYDEVEVAFCAPKLLLRCHLYAETLVCHVHVGFVLDDAKGWVARNVHFNVLVVYLRLYEDLKLLCLEHGAKFWRHWVLEDVGLMATPAIDLPLAIIEAVLAGKVHLQIELALVGALDSDEEDITDGILAAMDDQLVTSFTRTVPFSIFDLIHVANFADKEIRVAGEVCRVHVEGKVDTLRVARVDIVGHGEVEICA